MGHTIMQEIKETYPGVKVLLTVVVHRMNCKTKVTSDHAVIWYINACQKP